MKRIGLFFILTIISFCPAVAIDYSIDQLTTDDGLPSNRVYYVMKDSRDFMWFCTDQGVCRFNGIDIEVFTTTDGLTDNDVFNCFEDKWGRIWFATYNGKLCFFENEKFYSSNNCSWLKNDRSSGFTRIFVQSVIDSSFYVIVGSRDNVIKEVTEKTIKQKKMDLVDNKLGHELRGIFFYDGFNVVYTEIENIDLEKFNIDNSAYGVTIVKNNGIAKISDTTSVEKEGYTQIIYTNIGCKYIMAKNNRAIKLNQSLAKIKNCTNFILTAYKEYRDIEYLGTKNYLKIIENNKSYDYLKARHITGIEQSKYNTIYVSTYKNGVYILNKNDVSQKRYFLTENQDLRKYAKENSAFDIKNGAYMFVQNKCFKILKSGIRKLVYDFKSIKVQESILSNDTLLFLRLNQFIGQLNLNNNSFFMNGESTEKIVDMAIDNNNKLWLSSNSKFCWAKNGKDLTKMPLLGQMQLRKFIFLDGRIIAITPLNELIEIAHYNTKSPKKRTLQSLFKVKEIKKIDNTHFLIRDVKGYNHFVEYKKNRIRYLPLKNLLASAEWDNIFISDKKYILREENNFRVLEKSEIISKSEHTKIFGRTININDSTHLWSPNVKVDHTDRGKIIIQYLPLAKLNEQLIYEYAIVSGNKDTTWQSTNEPTVTLLNTSWGEYDLLFRMYNSQFEYSNTLKTNISISTPFYFRWWFITISLGILLFSTYYYTLLRSKKKTQEALEKKESEKKAISSEFKSLNAMMNPHFIFNSLNNIQNLINKNEKEKANEYLVVFSDIIRQNMQNIKDELVSLEKELTLAKNYIEIETLRFSAEIEFEMIIDPDIDLKNILIPPLTIQPLIENSIKHGIMPLIEKKGHILVRIEQTNKSIIIQVSDNGVGFEFSGKNSGTKTALKNITKRLNMLSGIHGKKYTIEILNNSKESLFTETVQIIIPM